LSDAADVLGTDQLIERFEALKPEGTEHITVGMVGFPNVGKSTVINALFGAKKCSMSRTPGHTKHFQTLELTGYNITLCDCPGLVMPSIVASKSHLVVNGVVPLDHLREWDSPTQIILEKMGMPTLLKLYKAENAFSKMPNHIRETTRYPEAREFLMALATARRHLLRSEVPDTHFAAKKLLRDYCTGAVVHCELPPNVPKPPPPSLLPDFIPGKPGTQSKSAPKKEEPAQAADEDESDSEEGADHPTIDDMDADELAAFLHFKMAEEKAGTEIPVSHTKRAQRMRMKRAIRGKDKKSKVEVGIDYSSQF